VSAASTGPETLRRLLRPQALCAGVSVAFTGRAGGVSAEPFATLNLSEGVGDDPAAVACNRDLVLQAIGPGVRRLAWMRQVHGTAVARVPSMSGSTRPDAAGPAPQADALCANVPGVALGVLGADCAPVLVADPAARIIGAAHAGRPGVAAGVVSALIAAMTDAGAEVRHMHAIIGPAICGQCYEVPASMRAEVGAAVPGSACTTRSGTPAIDLRGGLRGQLTRLGVAAIADDARCTAESAELYSYRRDGTTGRFAGLIWLT
jgi:purine-nucleoside/S-methyl-5'-thioadenosine phosphorylase / adenosine deaminase